MSFDSDTIARRFKDAAAVPSRPLDRADLERRMSQARRRRTVGYAAAATLLVAVSVIALPLLLPSGHTTLLSPGPAPTAAPDAYRPEPALEHQQDDPALLPGPPRGDDDTGARRQDDPTAADPKTQTDPQGADGDEETRDEPVGSETPDARLSLERTTVLPGQQVRFTVFNTGDVAFKYDATYHIERQTDRGWEYAAPWNAAWPEWVRELEPGARDDDLSMSTEDLMPGSYRLVKHFQAWEYHPPEDSSIVMHPGRFHAYANFTVVTTALGS